MFLGKVVCVSETAQNDLHDVLSTSVADTKDLVKVVQYCFDHNRISLVLHKLPMAFWSDLSEDQLRLMYGELEGKRIGLDRIGKGLDNLDAPRYEQLKILLSGDK